MHIVDIFADENNDEGAVNAKHAAENDSDEEKDAYADAATAHDWHNADADEHVFLPADELVFSFALNAL